MKWEGYKGRTLKKEDEKFGVRARRNAMIDAIFVELNWATKFKTLNPQR